MRIVKHPLAALGAVALLPLAACNMSESASADGTDADKAAPSEGVIRQETANPGAAAAPVSPMSVIQSQPGPDGSQVDLLRASVTGDILTLTLRCSSAEEVNNQSFRIADISIIDDTTSQRMSVLEDNQGKPMVSDPNLDGDYLGAECETRPGVIWLKFPAPPATSQTISLNLPEVGPFDGVTVTR